MSEAVMEQLMLLRAFTARTGILHEAQVLNLKMWPACVFSRVKSSEFTFDWENATVCFDIIFKGKRPKAIAKSCEALAHFTKTLLGPEYEVRISLNGKEEHVSYRSVVRPPPMQQPYDRDGFEERIRRRNFEKELKRLSDGRQADASENEPVPK